VKADFNADGNLDVAVIALGIGTPPTLALRLLYGKGDGTFQNPKDFTLPFLPWSLAVGDLNLDGAPDFVTANYGVNSITVIQQCQTQVCNPNFSLRAASDTLTVPRGSQGSDAITVSPENGSFASAIQLSCSVSGPLPIATCELSPIFVTPEGNSVTSTLTVLAPQIATTIGSGVNSSQYAVFLLLPRVSTLLLGFASCRSRKGPGRPWRLCVLFLVLAALQAGCGGESGPPPGPPPPLNYTVTVTATSGNIVHTCEIAVAIE
jgi:hypothetical protein